MRLSVLMRLFQECCIAHTEELGMGREKTLDRGLLWVVISEMIKIQRMPVYDEEITLVCYPGKTLHYFFPRQLTVLDRDGEEIIRIGEFWALIDQKTRQITDPKEYGIVINGEDRPGDISSPFSLPAIELPNTETECRAVYSLVDINGHLNNTHYLDMALTHPFKTVKCVFKKEIPAGTKFDLHWGKVGDTYHFRNEFFALDLSQIP